MKRLSASACSGASSPTSLEDSPSLFLHTPSKQLKVEQSETDITVVFETDKTMITPDPPPLLSEGTTPSHLDTPDVNEISPSFRRNFSAGDVSTPEKPYLESSVPKAASTDGKRKKTKKKTVEVLDWRNFNNNGKEASPRNAVASQGELPSDSSNTFIPDKPAKPQRENSNGSTSSSVSQTTTTSTCRSTGEISATTEENTIPGYGQPHNVSVFESTSEAETISFGTKNNPVKENMNLKLLGLPNAFGSKRVFGRTRTDKDRRAQSSSSERGILGLGNKIVPLTCARPMTWGEFMNDGETSKGDDGCCEDEWKDRRVEKTRGDKEIPDHTEQYIDSHCHLDFIYDKFTFSDMQTLRQEFNESFLPTFKGCIANFIKPSFFKYDEWIKKVVMDKQVLGTSWGVHPHHSGTSTEDSMQQLKEFVINNKEILKIVAIGECGIDLSGKNDVPLKKQLEVFKLQVDMAYELDLPIIIHCREGTGMGKDPEDEVLNVLKQRPNHPIHRHCFTRDANVAKKWMSTLHDCSFGFTPLVTNREWFDQLPGKIIPIDRIHLETDAPFFKAYEYKCFNGPPYNSSLPGAAITVAIRISEITGYSLDEVIRRTRGCTNRIYRLHKFD